MNNIDDSINLNIDNILAVIEGSPKSINSSSNNVYKIKQQKLLIQKKLLKLQLLNDIQKLHELEQHQHCHNSTISLSKNVNNCTLHADNTNLIATTSSPSLIAKSQKGISSSVDIPNRQAINSSSSPSLIAKSKKDISSSVDIPNTQPINSLSSSSSSSKQPITPLSSSSSPLLNTKNIPNSNQSPTILCQQNDENIMNIIRMDNNKLIIYMIV